MREFLRATYDEFRLIFRDEGVLLILVFAPIIYATIYSLTYGTQVLRNIPIGIVDNDHTPASRRLTNALGAGENAYIAYEPTDMQEAKKLFFDREIYGIVYIPNGYERDIIGGSRVVVPIYLDASYMLMYRQAFEDMATSIATMNATVEFQHLLAKGAQIPQAEAIVEPVRYASHTLFNPYLGYGSFVMPPVIILILQQTLLIGICMIGGTARERGLTPTSNILRTIFSKALCYFCIYAILSLYLLNVHFRLFHYPMNGHSAEIAIFISLYLLAFISMSLALSVLFHRRETPLMVLLWCSIPLLMLSGVSFPTSALPKWLQWLANVFPSTHGVHGFIKLQTMGASLLEVAPEITALSIMMVVYFALTYVGFTFIAKKNQNLSSTQHPNYQPNKPTTTFTHQKIA